MNDIISLTSIIHAKKELKSLKVLDSTASRTALEICLTTLNMNNLKELDPIKKEINKTIQKMKELENA